MDWIYEPFAWYIGGPLIAITMFLMHFVGDGMGISTNFKTFCTISGAGKISDFFKTDWKTQKWNLIFVLGMFLGGLISFNFLEAGSLELTQDFKDTLNSWRIDSTGNTIVPQDIFSWENLKNGNGWFFLILGPFLIGFGSRYAQGCTSGHAISGLSNLQFRSLIAVIGFFIGGLFTTYFLLPLIF